MSKGNAVDLGLKTAFDELFMSDAGRAENRLPKIYDIPLTEIDDFPEHPFKVMLDEDMDQLVQSIKERGIITPITLRQKEDGRYEIVSGHRRKKACELAGLETVKSEIKELTRDEAIILMVESNYQRSSILPSEKAFAYKMRLEAMKRQAGRPSKENCDPVGHNLAGIRSVDVMAEDSPDSRNQIQRYVRLTELSPDLLNMVDETRIAFRPAVELSYLKEDEQKSLLEAMTYTTDANGQFTTRYYICDDDWSVREINPSEGYLLDSGSYHVGAEPELYTIELNSTGNDVTEQVIKGNIALIKHTDNGDTQIETPETGAEFSVYLKSAGSYVAAKETERDYLTCDENGFAQTKDMPYGIYTVHQVSGWEDRELMPDFDVYISQNGATYRYLINNANFESYIKVIKTDAETGKTIPYAGAAFQIYNPDGSLVSMTFTYPTPTTIDTFYTNADGYLVTPEKLPYGDGYSIVEVQAPYGYTLNAEPVYFNITPDGASEEGGVTVVEVERPNMAQKGVINISKTGEVFSTVTEANGVYQPVYEVKGLAGAVYEVTAAEDIYTLDGTLRASAGEVVDTVTTGADGIAKTKELYLGKYDVKEITAPTGMVLNGETHSVELVYAGQEIAVTETATSYYNERQKVEISLNKKMEADATFGIGGNGEIADVTFGIYAATELTAADGSVIPADGLLEIVSVSSDGTAKFAVDLPIGSYYVRELATNAAYLISDAKYPVEFTYAGQDAAVVTISAKDGNVIDNELLRGEIHGLKKDEDGKALGGAVMGLFKADATEFTKDTALLTDTSAEDGSFSFKNVPYGSYVVREIEAPTGFALSDTTYSAVIDKDGAVVEIEVANTRIRGNVQLTKVDKEYPDNHLSGAVFEVYQDTDGDQKLGKDDTLLGTMTELTGGVYKLDSLLYGGYFIKEKTAPAGFILDENAYYFAITENGKTMNVENEAGKGFLNAAQTGNIRIEKTSEDKVVKGFTFKVEGVTATGEQFSKEYVTDDNGEIHIEGLRIGDYVISEVSNDASAKYVLPDKITVTVLEGKTTVAKFYNELKPVTPDVPKTGDTTNIALWAALCGLSLAGIGAAAFFGFRKKKNHESEDR